MLKLTVKNEDVSAIDDIVRLSGKSIKSKVFYPGFDIWLHTKFLPGLGFEVLKDNVSQDMTIQKNIY